MTGIITPVESQSLGALRVVELGGAGCTYRQLDHWTRKRYIRSDMRRNSSGIRRMYSPTEARIFMLMVEFVVCGIEVGTAAGAARMMIENETLQHPLGDGVTLLIDALPEIDSTSA